MNFSTTFQKKYLTPWQLTWGIFFLCSLVMQQASAQKKLHKNWDATSIQTLEIDAKNVFKITVETSSITQIEIELWVEGEHFESVVMETSIINNTLSILPCYRPFYTSINDKLAANKVVSIEMKCFLPKELEVLITAPAAQIKTLGSFKSIQLNVHDGPVILDQFAGNANINTFNGDIVVKAKENVKAAALTKYGTVNNELPEKGLFLINAESVNGNITLLKAN